MSPATRNEKVRKRSARIFSFAAFVLIAFTTSAQTLRISDVRIGADGRIVLQHTADTNSYYILLRGDQVTAILTARDMQFGVVGTNQLKDPNIATNAGFYRVRQVPLSNPLDTDGDGIDDVYELKYWPLLDPFNPSDANLDPDGDGRTTLEEFRAGRNPFVADLPEVTTISYPTNATAASFVIFSGVATTNTLIRVEGGAAYVTNAVDSGGAFVVTVALSPNRLNRLFVSAIDEFGNVSAPVPIDILQDSVAPYLFIDFPTNGAVITTSNTLVAGRVGDALSGFLGLNVTVNGEAANVDVGIGPNGTFQRMPVSLGIGTNQITVVASDRLGNSITKSITLIREQPIGPRLFASSGDLQQTNILRRLAEPLVIKATQPGGAPIANQLVNFQVTRSDGRLLPVNTNQLANDPTLRPDYSTNGAMFLQLFTDTNGEARAWWTMGTDAGHANNRVTVSASNIQETVYFCASATALPAKQINIGSGNNQKGETMGHAPEPLKVWVSDGNNPVAGVPVTFTVVQGGGELMPIVDADGASPAGPGLRASRPTGSIALKKSRAKSGASEVTVLTSITGHAEVDWIFGPDGGNQMVEATFTNSVGNPATFVARVLARVPGRPTSFSGLIQDNTMQPIGRAYCELTVAGATLSTYSDTQGHFGFLNIPSGAGHLLVNGSSANTLGTNSVPTNSFPSLQYTIAIVPNAENSLSTPVLLPRLNTNNAQWYYGTNDIELTCEGIEGLKMIIKANSMKHPDGQIVSPGRPALVSLNQVHHDNVPMPMPDGASPPFAWTLQPGGATFDPPVQVEYPNMSGLAPGAAAFFLTFNHDTERFEIVASGHVIEDGSKIVCDPNAGLTISGWGCNCPPYSVTGNIQECSGSPAPALARNLNGIASAPMVQKLAHSDLTFADHSVWGPGPMSKPKMCGETTLHGTNVHSFCDCDDIGIVEANFEVTSSFYWSNITRLEDIESVRTHEHKHITDFRAYFDTVQQDAVGFADVRFADSSACEAARKEFDKKVAKAHKYFSDATLILDLMDSKACSNLLFRYKSILASPKDEDESGAGMDDLTVLSDPPWVFQVNGQTITQDFPGGFRISNISAPDQFGPAGPGSVPDFVSDDYVRITGHSATGGTNRYAFSEFFQIRQGQTFAVNNLTFTDLPVGKPESLDIVCTNRILRVGEPRQLEVLARFAGDITTNVTSKASWTSYRISNPNLATVSPDGLIMPLKPGVIYVTAVNEGATAACALNVVAGQDGLTTVTGTVVDTNGLPIAGATVRLFDLIVEPVTSGPDGRFTILNVPTTLGVLRLNARVVVNGRAFMASLLLPGVSGGVTQAGTVTLLPLDVVGRRFDAGGGYTVALRNDSTLWTWGYTPQPIQTNMTWKAVAAGNAGMFALPGDGTLWSWGIGGTPQRIQTNMMWQAVSAGYDHTVALRADGTLWTWGGNANGQLGNGTFTSTNTPQPIQSNATWQAIAAGTTYTLAVRADGTLWRWGTLSAGIRTNTPQWIQTNVTWQAVAAGWDHVVALRADGTLWTWGNNQKGQLGLGIAPYVVFTNTPQPIQTNTTWRAIGAGEFFTLAVRADGTLWAWGDNSYGALGNGTYIDAYSPQQIQTNRTWQAVAAGGVFAVASQTDGTLWSWGLTDFVGITPIQRGGLGNGTLLYANTPQPIQTNAAWEKIVAGVSQSAAIGADGTLWTWGNNQNGQLGNGTLTTTNTPQPIQTNVTWQMIASGYNHFLGLRTNGTLWAWGVNTSGQLGNGTVISTNRPQPIQTNVTWQTVAGGGAHTVAIRTNGTLWAWGANNQGQLGNGTYLNANTPRPVETNTTWQAVAAGNVYSAALRGDGTLWTWGDNVNGQLGNGTFTGTNTPQPIQTNMTWQAIAAGELHMAALRADGTLWTWGDNAYGQLGNGTTIRTNAPQPIQTNVTWQAIAAGRYYTLALRADGTLWAWGDNSYGQLGVPTSVARTPQPIQTNVMWRAVAAAAGGNHTLGVRTDRTLWAWGDNSKGQIAQPLPWFPNPVLGGAVWGPPQ